MRGCAGWESPETQLGIVLKDVWQKMELSLWGNVHFQPCSCPVAHQGILETCWDAVDAEFHRSMWSPSQVSESQKDLSCSNS